jgi:ribosomal protein S27AE
LHPGRKAVVQARARRWNAEHPVAYRSHYLVSNAIRDGRLIKQPCVICGAARAHAHHKDYTKPLDVTWLCAKCHTRIHAAFPELTGHR